MGLYLMDPYASNMFSSILLPMDPRMTVMLSNLRPGQMLHDHMHPETPRVSHGAWVLGATCTNPNANELVEFLLPGLVDAMPWCHRLFKNATGSWSWKPPWRNPSRMLGLLIRHQGSQESLGWATPTWWWIGNQSSCFLRHQKPGLLFHRAAIPSRDLPSEKAK